LWHTPEYQKKNIGAVCHDSGFGTDEAKLPIQMFSTRPTVRDGYNLRQASYISGNLDPEDECRQEKILL
jgi:hypothetical protein